MRSLLVSGASVAVVMAFSACGSDDEEVVRTVTVGADEVAEDESATQPEPDETSTDEESCNALGINPEQLKEGPCETDDGTRLLVVNRSTPLKMKQMRVSLESITPTETIEVPYDSPLVGSFVVARVSVTNRLDAPTQIDATEMFSLDLGSKSYTPDFDAMNTGSDDSLIYEEMQPGETRSGPVVFKVGKGQVDELDKSGNLNVLQFSDASGYGERAKQRIGVIRTYN